MEVWLFILGYIIQFAGSFILLTKIYQQKSVYGLSIDTQICYVLSTFARCFWSFETRLIENALSYLEMLTSLTSVIMLTYAIYSYRYTCTNKTWWPFKSHNLILVSIILATLFHPGPKRWSIQILVAFTIYLEAIALIPQLHLMHNIIEIESLTSHYVGLLIISRITRLFFWINLFINGETFIGLFLADLFHSLCSADYFFLWCSKLSHGGTLLYKIPNN